MNAVQSELEPHIWGLTGAAFTKLFHSAHGEEPPNQATASQKTSSLPAVGVPNCPAIAAAAADDDDGDGRA